MTTHRFGRVLQNLAALSSFLGLLGAYAPTAAAQEYREPATNRDTGVSIDRYIGSWKNSEPRVTHGFLVERAILSPGDPYQPGPPGAVLEFHKNFSLATLMAGGRTATAQHAELEVLYIESGGGRLESGESFWPLQPGYAVLIAPRTDHVLVAEPGEPLTLLALAGPVDPGTSPARAILVRDSAQIPYAETSAHWNYFAKMLFGPKDGLNAVEKVLIVDLFPMTIGGPHPHVPHWEEVWCKLPPEGSFAFLGSEPRAQGPNEAFLVPPNGKTVHSVINLTDRPMSWFYFGHYTVKVEYPDWVYAVPSIAPQKIPR